MSNKKILSYKAPELKIETEIKEIEMLRANLILTKQILNKAVDKELLEQLQKYFMFEFTKKLVAASKVVWSNPNIGVNYNYPSGYYEITQDVETIDDDRLASRYAAIARNNEEFYRTVEKLNSVSIWRILWNKIRGRKFIEWAY